MLAMAQDLEITLYLRHLVEEWLRANKGASAAELARRAGITPTHLSTLRNSLRGAGMKTMRGLAQVFGLSLGDLERDAAAWAKANPAVVPKAAEIRVEREDRYPNRAKAIVAARALGMSEDAIRIVSGVALRSDTDPSPREWLDEIEHFERRTRLGLGDLVNTPEDEAELRRLEEAGRSQIGKLPTKR